MKPRSHIFLLLAMVWLLGGTGMEYARATELWNSSGLTTISESDFPALHGMTLVWQARGGLAGAVSGSADREIFLCDLASLQVVQLTDDDADDTLPQTDGEYVVWQKYDSAAGRRIFLYRIAAGSPAGGEMISPADGSDNHGPRIAAGHVVWTSQLVTDSYRPGRIMLYQAGGQQAATVISDPAADCSDPRLDAEKVVWLQTGTDGSVDHWYYDLTADTPVARPVPDRFTFNRTPTMDNHLDVLARRDGTDSEIFLYSRNKGFWRITDNSTDDRFPVISQNHIAWIAGDNVHVADVTPFLQVAGLQPSGMLPQGFIAAWDQLSGGVDTYLLDLSTDPEFSSFVPGYHDLDVGAQTRFDISGLDPELTYYVRVRAVVNGETSDYSPVVAVHLVPVGTGGDGTRGRMRLDAIMMLLLR